MTRSRLLMGGAALIVVLGGHSPAAAVSANRLPRGSERVHLDPTDFTVRIDNPYFAMTPGDRRVYRTTDPENPDQRSVVTVTNDTKRIANGTTARVVYTVVLEGGKRIEDNSAWYAQDKLGNVWYLGEAAREFDHGKLQTTKGSWEPGVDGAQPGVVMPAHPRVGLTYREEYAKGVAEDRGEVFNRRERVEVPFGRFGRALLIKETEGIERTLLDYKFYVRGVGPVLGVEISAGSGREELVSFRRGK